MRVLVVFAHPLDDSYAAALRDTIVETLKASAHTVDLCERPHLICARAARLQGHIR
jgi:putative NADPH-quinone reductase